MNSVLRRFWVLGLLASFIVMPGVVLAQSAGTFTVTKTYSISGSGEVDVTLTCTNGYGPIEQTTSSLTTEFDIGGGVYHDNWVGLDQPTTCTATETVPAGYESDETINCTDVTLAETTPPDQDNLGGEAEGSCTIDNTPLCGNGVVDAGNGEACDLGSDNGAAGSCCTAECTFVAAEAVCRAGSGDSCDPAEVCDGNSATCPTDSYEPNTTVCRTASGNVCDLEELCTGTPGDACPTDLFADGGTLCGDSSETECTDADTCDGAGVCLDNHKPDTTTCGDDGSECIAQDYCDGEGLCDDKGLLACGLINAGGCPIEDSGACDAGSDFRLLFTPDVQNWVSYKLNATNPGQTFYTMVSDPDIESGDGVVLTFPFPFVTQGSMTLDIYDAAEISALTDPEQVGCLLTDGASPTDSLPLEISMDDWWGASDCAGPGLDFPIEAGFMCFDEGELTTPNGDCPDHYDSPAAALGNCVYYYPFEAPDGQFVANLHLDYGLKGKWIDDYCPDDSYDRYVPGSSGVTGFDARGIDITAANAPTGCDIPTCQDYTFVNADENFVGDIDTITSYNEFKKPTGVFGQAFCEQAGLEGYEGLWVTLRRAGSDTVLASATTDEDGMYFINYQHKGKAAKYIVRLYEFQDVDESFLSASGELELKGSIKYVEQDFSNDDLGCDAGEPTWTAD